MMLFSDILAGLEERFAALGHNTILRAFTPDGDGAFMECDRCRLKFDVYQLPRGNWEILDGMLAVMDTECVGTYAPGRIADQQRVVADLEQELNEARFRLAALQHAAVAQLEAI